VVGGPAVQVICPHPLEPRDLGRVAGLFGIYVGTGQVVEPTTVVKVSTVVLIGKLGPVVGAADGGGLYRTVGFLQFGRQLHDTIRHRQSLVRHLGSHDCGFAGRCVLPDKLGRTVRPSRVGASA
jgi:hypothetical protein